LVHEMSPPKLRLVAAPKANNSLDYNKITALTALWCHRLVSIYQNRIMFAKDLFNKIFRH